MKHLSLLVLILTLGLASLAQSTGGLPGKTESFIWDHGYWVQDHEHVTQYTDQGLISQDVINRQGQATERSTWWYDDQDQLIRQQNQSKSGGLWQNRFQYLYSGFMNRVPSKIEYQEYIGGVWMTQWGTWSEFQFEGSDPDQRIKTEIRNAFWPSDGYWHPQTRITWDYGQDGLKSGCLIEESDNQQGWNLARREFYTWEKDGQPDVVMYDLWNGNEWQPGGRIHYRYSANESVETTYYLWDPGLQVYSGYERITRNFDEKGTLILDSRDILKVTGWEISSGNRWTPAYQDGKLIELTRESWSQDPEGAASGVFNWNIATRDLFSEFFTAGIESITTIASQFQVYPNPSKGMVTVKGTDIFLPGDRLVVLDANGRLVANWLLDPGKVSMQVDLGLFQRGWYLLRILTSNSTIATRLLILN
jgi:hypothetical protein